MSLRFDTNTSQQSPEQVLRRLWGLGFEVSDDELYTAPAAMAAYLRARRQNWYALVDPGLDERFAPFASSKPDAVVVADAGERLDYARLTHAFRCLMEGAELIAIGDNRYFRRAGDEQRCAVPGLTLATDVAAALAAYLPPG